LIADNSFLLEKAYSQFLNDFWFDWVKLLKNANGKPKFNISDYRREFGYFFETYLFQTLTKCFENYKYSTLLMFDQLKVKGSNGEVEIADIYLRSGNKILLGQVKSGSIYDTEKFGGSVEDLYKNDRNAFFDNFGVNQIVKSLTRMNDFIQFIDPKFPKGHSIEVYPCIIVNDKAFQTALMPDIFTKRFNELLVDVTIKKMKLKPLTLIHISDCERLEDSLNKNPKAIWKLLQYNHQNKIFIPPFYHTIDRNIKGRQYSDRIMELYKSLIHKYNPSGLNE
jgi:hypothetical protein